jgi:hypothetical protein
MAIFAHMGGIPELLTLLSPLVAFGLGGYFLVYRPMREGNDEAVEHESELVE